MTVGSISKDGRVPVTVPSYWGGFYDIYIGESSSRSWSGGDYPSVKPVKPFSHNRVPALEPPPRPPKRTRTEDHSYTMSASKVYDGIVHLVDGPVFYRYSAFASEGGRISSGENPWTSNDDIALLGKLRTKIAGSDFNAGVFLGEGKESLKMIADSATRIYRGIKSARRLDFAGVYSALFQPSQTRRFKNYRSDGWLDDENFLKWERRRWNQKALNQRPSDRDISSLWLEFSYGWKPLLQDVYGAAEFLGQQLNPPLSNVVRVSLTRKNSSLVTTSPSTRAFASNEFVVKKWVKAKITEVDPVKLSGLMDPLSVAWELVPFSFVVDWFIPVGNYLSARGLVSSLEGTMVISTLTIQKAKGIKAINSSSQIVSDGGSFLEYVSFQRAVNQPIANLLSLPGMKPLSSVPSWARAANAVSLLDQLRPRK